MRKLKIQVQMSIDGYIANPGGKLDWMTWNWDSELRKYVFNLTRPVDCIVLGKNLANEFINTWQERLKDPATSDAFARKMVETQKIVFSQTIDRASWKNTRLAKGDLADEIIRLKKTKGRDIIAYGGVSFLTSLIKTGLIDEYNLFINPIILGSGLSIFHNPEKNLKLDLVYSTSFECGITALCYTSQYSQENSRIMTYTADSANSV